MTYVVWIFWNFLCVKVKVDFFFFFFFFVWVWWKLYYAYAFSCCCFLFLFFFGITYECTCASLSGWVFFTPYWKSASPLWFPWMIIPGSQNGALNFTFLCVPFRQSSPQIAGSVFLLLLSFPPVSWFNFCIAPFDIFLFFLELLVASFFLHFQSLYYALHRQYVWEIIYVLKCKYNLLFFFFFFLM